MKLEHRDILGVRVDGTSYAKATEQVLGMAKRKEAGYVCVCNVHMIMEAYDDAEFRKLVNEAKLVTPDGMPLVAGLRMQGLKEASRVYGPHLTLAICEAASKAKVPIGLYGGRPESLKDFTGFLEQQYPGIQISCTISPPFRPLTAEETEAYVNEVNESGTQILFVGIGCPRQEKWMAANTKQLKPVMLGVGAAFDFYSGRVRQAPAWMQAIALEWLFRFVMEPKRLWKRYMLHNPRFVLFFGLQLLGIRLVKKHDRSHQ